MTSASDIQDWLKKLNYPGEIPPEDALQSICRGAMGPIFQQLINKVKPKNEIDSIRKNILINSINDKIKIKERSVALEMYEKKKELEEKLMVLRERNQNEEDNLEILKSKVRSKSARTQLLKNKIRENQKDETLIRAKCTELEKRLESCKKLKEESKSLENALKIKNTHPSEIKNKVNNAISVLSDQADKIEVTAQVPEKPFRGSNSSFNRLMSTAKKPMSIRKNHSSSTRKNIFQSVNNLFLGSTLKKRNVDRHQLTFLSNTTLNSVDSSKVTFVEKSFENSLYLDNAFNNFEVQKLVDNLWLDGNRGAIFEVLKDMKMEDKNKIAKLISETQSVDNFAAEDSNIDTLYACHIQNELVRKQLERGQKRYLDVLKNKYDESTDDFTKLQAIEHGLKAAKTHLQNNIKHLILNTLDNPNLDSILSEIDKNKLEMISMKNKIENQLCLLYDSRAWIDKCYRKTLEAFSRPYPVFESHILQDNLLYNSSEKFCTLPLQYNNKSYLESWNEVFSNQELLEIIHSSYLSRDKILEKNNTEKIILQKLQSLQIEPKAQDFSKILSADCKVFNENSVLNKMQDANEICRKTIYNYENTENLLKMQLNFPFVEFVSEDRKFNGKNLKEYFKEYDNLYKQLN